MSAHTGSAALTPSAREEPGGSPESAEGLRQSLPLAAQLSWDLAFPVPSVPFWLTNLSDGLPWSLIHLHKMLPLHSPPLGPTVLTLNQNSRLKHLDQAQGR